MTNLILYRHIFSFLNQSTTSYALLRDYHDFPENIKGDCDIILKRERLKAFKAYLVSLAEEYFLFLKIHKETHSVFKVSVYDKKNETLLTTLHIVSFITVSTHKKPLCFYLSPRISLNQLNTEKKTINAFTFQTLTVEHEYLLLLLKYTQTKDEKQKIKLLNFIELNQYSPPEKLLYTHDLSTKDFRKALHLNPLVTITILAYYVLTKPFKRPYFKASIFYFSGPDGAGKTTAFLEVKNFLNNMNLKNTSIKHAHFLFWLLQTKKRNESHDGLPKSPVTSSTKEKKKRDRNDGSLKWFIRRYVGLVITLMDTIIFGRLYLKFHQKKKTAILIETAPYDRFVKKHRPRYKLTERFLRHLIPKPTKAFLLVADPSVIHERKKQLHLDELHEYYQRMNQIISPKKILKHYINIDSSQTVDITRNQILKSILYGHENK